MWVLSGYKTVNIFWHVQKHERKIILSHQCLKNWMAHVKLIFKNFIIGALSWFNIHFSKYLRVLKLKKAAWSGSSLKSATKVDRKTSEDFFPNRVILRCRTYLSVEKWGARVPWCANTRTAHITYHMTENIRGLGYHCRIYDKTFVSNNVTKNIK